MCIPSAIKDQLLLIIEGGIKGASIEAGDIEYELRDLRLEEITAEQENDLEGVVLTRDEQAGLREELRVAQDMNLQLTNLKNQVLSMRLCE